MRNFKQPGKTLTFTNGESETVKSGAGVVLGSKLFGVSSGDVEPAAIGEAQIEGVFELPKIAADTPAQWATAYFKASTGELTTTASGNVKVGVFVKAAAAGDAIVEVRLIPAC